jgi:hypothetical protein
MNARIATNGTVAKKRYRGQFEQDFNGESIFGIGGMI